MKKKKVPSIVLFITTTFSGAFLFSCGTPEVAPAVGYNYKAFSAVSPECTCKNKTGTSTSPSPVATLDPTPLKTPVITSTDKDYGWQSPAPGVTPTPAATAPPTEPEKKKTLIGQWIEKIGNIFKKKKTE